MPWSSTISQQTFQKAYTEELAMFLSSGIVVKNTQMCLVKRLTSSRSNRVYKDSENCYFSEFFMRNSTNQIKPYSFLKYLLCFLKLEKKLCFEKLFSFSHSDRLRFLCVHYSCPISCREWPKF